MCGCGPIYSTCRGGTCLAFQADSGSEVAAVPDLLGRNS